MSSEEGGGGLIKRSLTINGHRTSIALEQQFWEHLERIARVRGLTVPVMVGEIDNARVETVPDATLASSIRVFVLLNRES
jgi:predicted DNA-binding ribbon-helix-helix protein